MKLHNNDTVFDNSHMPDSQSPISSRVLALALIAIPCLIVVFGLFIDMLISGITDINLAYLLLAVPALLILSTRLLLRRNSSSLILASRWTFKSYQESIAGLDERERQVIDQAYRMAYRIMALACWLVLAGVLADIYMWHLTYTYQPGQIGIFCIIIGIIDLLSYLPTAIVLWKEEA